MSQPVEHGALDASWMKGTPVEKVTAFIMRERAGVDELLLLYHPFAGIQLPAGTVEAGESAREAAEREAREESGLEGLVWGGLVGEERHTLPETGFVALTTPVHTRPDAASMVIGSLRRGLPVGVRRASGDFLQVHYSESDQFLDPQYMTCELLGWVPANTISNVRIRYFAWLTAPNDTPPSWTNFEDHHTFTLRWHRIDDLPELVSTQAPWLRYLPKR